MSTHAGQGAGTSSQEHHAATSYGDSRMQNGNNYYYYASDMRIASLAQGSTQIKAPSDPATENGAKLWRAARAGQLPRVQRLLKLGADVSYRCNEHGTTALHQAVENSHDDVVKALLEADASVDDEDYEGNTALHFATSVDIVEALITAGADVDHEDREGKTPGRIALDRNNAAVVEALVRGRADPSKIYEPRGGTDRTRRVKSGKQEEEEEEEDEEEETSLQHDHVGRVTNSSARYEQDTPNDITTLAADLSDIDLRPTAGDSDRTSLTTTDYQTTRQAPPQQHAVTRGRDQTYESSTTVTPEVRGQLSAAVSLPTLDIDGSNQGLKLIIGIELERTIEFTDRIGVSYAVGHDEMSSKQYILYDDFDPAHAIAESHFPDSFIQGLDSDERFPRARINPIARSKGDTLSALVVALDTQISAEVASMHGGSHIRKFQKEIVMIVPTKWSHRLKYLTVQAAKIAEFREVTVITAEDAAVLSEFSSENVNPICIGDVYMFCQLVRQKLLCAKKQVISTKPFRLTPLGESQACNIPHVAYEGIRIFDMLKSQSKLAAEQRARDLENEIHWSKEIRKFASRRALDSDATNGRIKAIFLEATQANAWTWTRGRRNAIREVFPTVKIIHMDKHRAVDRSEVLRETVMHHLRA